MALAAIGLGSNRGDPRHNVERACTALDSVGTVVARSSLYVTRAWGETAQPDFINAVALVETALEPRDLLAALQRIEAGLGRTPSYRWGPREIDLDILTYGEAAFRDEALAIPHERLTERAFALAPLAEIVPEYLPVLAALPVAERESVQRIPARAARTGTTVDWDETLERVRGAAEFCAAAGLVRFRIEEEGLAIDIRRTAGPVPVLGLGRAESDSAPNGAAPSNGVLAQAEPPASVLKAEFVGVVRLSRPSVHDGSVLSEDRELAYVESLGIRNPIRSGGPGRIAQVFVTEGEAVEFGQPLFAIEK
ncbi:MAG: 2-amino-4-hydroxy-6-hydroxymethyldihydropteridine diphosphokinase [Candidatus Eremiobacteraeota bacterium]|nr:2-amino-4-hydroxy-6-hydroxymethyldihydropteridine diphosphokinase [Candidatus Eremiobacteraeota bacterium]